MAFKLLESLHPATGALVLFAALLGGTARAEEPPAAAPAAAPTAAPVARPERGARMTDVEQHFGAPSTRYPAVGQPPITRWDYPNMVVYFEHDRVIHTVLVSPNS